MYMRALKCVDEIMIREKITFGRWNSHVSSWPQKKID